MPRRHDIHQLTRRAALLALTGLFAAPHLRALQRPLERVPTGTYPFTLGVASGMPRPGSVVIWTRLAPQPHEPLGGLPDAPLAVQWEVAEDEGFSRRLRRGQAIALPANAHSVHVEVEHLWPGATYFYRFIAGGVSSPVGRTRTAPAPDAEVPRLRLALASCQHYEQGAFAVHREIASRDLDLVLFVGDYIYESTNPRFRIRPHDGPVPMSLAAYRARHATYKLDADLRAAHAAHPWVVTWDDHEVQNDYAGEHSPGDLGVEAFLRRRAAAYKAYFEHMPVSPRMAPRGPSMQIHDRWAWGRLADLWTLDGRQYRSVQPCLDGRGAGGRVTTQCDELQTVSRSILGETQERWLAQGLAESPRQWKLLAQGSQISESSIDTPAGRSVYTDGWDGYPQARRRLLAAIAEPRVSDVLCLGGDVHRHVAANLRLQPNDTRSAVVASEFVCSSVSTRGLSEALTTVMRSSNPDLVHARSDERGYALIELTPSAAHCDFRATAFPVQPMARLYSQAQVRVESGRPGVQPA